MKKAKTVQLDTVGYNPRSKLRFCWIFFFDLFLCTRSTSVTWSFISTHQSMSFWNKYGWNKVSYYNF